MFNLSRRSMFLLWLGASVSIAEIYTGGLMAPLGLGKGLLIILIGHVIGCAMMLWGGLIAFDRKETAMDSVRFSLGSSGVKLVAACNVLQLIGWTLVMIVQGSSTLVSVIPGFPFRLGVILLAVATGIWALLFLQKKQIFNDILVILLVILAALLLIETGFNPPDVPLLSGNIGMILALELSIAMPVSWLPLVGDYAREADSKATVILGTAGYFIGSCLIYAFGLYMVIQTGTDFFTAIAASRFKWIAAGVVLLSTITTAFLDLYSAAVSTRQIFKVHLPKLIFIYALFAMSFALVFPMEAYSAFLTSFLTMIGSIFVPVYSVVFLDAWTGKKASLRSFDLPHLLIAAAGVLCYHAAAKALPFIPTTLLVIGVVTLLYLIFLRKDVK